ncbi:uncharacterized protein [Procambarus clarkii]|uniref:uncharacterized protein isoform X1 n=2 Tax=Procambarus clarkii TaxID=6728 RepID=UPI003741F72B
MPTSKRHKYKEKQGCRVNSEVFVYINTGPQINARVEWKQVSDHSVTQVDPDSGVPVGRTYTFDKVCFGKSNEYMYEESVKSLIKKFLYKKFSGAVILYGTSRTGKSKYYRKLFHLAINDIMNYLRTLTNSSCVLRMTCVDVYKENVEDLLVCDLFNATPALQLTRDANDFVVWSGARTPFITSKKEMMFLCRKAYIEHIRRGRKDKDRLKSDHTIIRLILESAPHSTKNDKWEVTSMFTSYLDFVLVAGSELTPTYTSLAEELNVDLLTKSFFSLHNFVNQTQMDKNELYDSRKSTLMQILREMLIGKGHSVFVCFCDSADFHHTRATLNNFRFGVAAARLIQHPRKNKYPFCYSMLGTIARKLKENVVVLRKNRLKLKSILEFESMETEKKLHEQFVHQMHDYFTEIKVLLDLVFPLHHSDKPVDQMQTRRRPGRKKKCNSQPVYLKYWEPLEKINYIGKWKPHYPSNKKEKHRNAYDENETLFITNIYDKRFLDNPKMKNMQKDKVGLPMYYMMTGSIKKHDKSKYYGGYVDIKGLEARRCDDGTKERKQMSFINYVKGPLIISKNWIAHNLHKISDCNLINEAYLPRDHKPMKVYFPLNKLKPAEHIGCAEDGYTHYHRLLWWILRHIYDTGAIIYENEKEILQVKMPDFIALKEVFINLYLTPYRRTIRHWKIKAVTYDDGRVYIQDDHSLKRKKNKISHEAAFNAFLRGQVLPQKEDCCYNKESVKYRGDYWNVCWGEVDGLGLLYSSKVDIMDHWTKLFQWHKPQSGLEINVVPPEADAHEYKIRIAESVRTVTYKTHLYKAPADTKSWKEYQWNEMLDWWADYQFGGVPNIIGGEVEGETVTALRLFSSANLPLLAKLWCCKESGWDPNICEKYMSSVLRFIKMCCSKIPREVLSFELKENGDVVCIKRNFTIKNKNFDPNQILPKEFIQEVYPESGKKRRPKPKIMTDQPIPMRRRINKRKNAPAWHHFLHYKPGDSSCSGTSSCSPTVAAVFGLQSRHSSDDQMKAKKYR